MTKLGIVKIMSIETSGEVHLRDIGIKVKLLIFVKIDNIVAIFTSKNASMGVRTRHIKTHYYFIQENMEVGTYKLNFFVDNDSRKM